MTESLQQNHDEMFQKSALYLGFLAERDEILRHKWIESQKAGQDIGFEKSLIDWIMLYRSGWRAACSTLGEISQVRRGPADYRRR